MANNVKVDEIVAKLTTICWHCGKKVELAITAHDLHRRTYLPCPNQKCRKRCAIIRRLGEAGDGIHGDRVGDRNGRRRVVR